jgi:hypothetical protein
MTRARLYLDVDGVLNAPDCATVWPGVAKKFTASQRIDDYVLHFGINYSPALIAALDALVTEFEVELVWATTWNEDLLVLRTLVPEFGALNDGRVLPFFPGRGGASELTWKHDGILADQRDDPAPFVWADDVEVREHGRLVGILTDITPSLLLDVNARTGLTPADLDAMHSFLEGLRS